MEHPINILRPYFKAADQIIHDYGDYLMVPVVWAAAAYFAYLIFRKRRPRPPITVVVVHTDQAGVLMKAGAIPNAIADKAPWRPTNDHRCNQN